MHRGQLAPLKTLIELALGPRVLGALASEGLGEVFLDGRLNRGLCGAVVRGLPRRRDARSPARAGLPIRWS